MEFRYDEALILLQCKKPKSLLSHGFEVLYHRERLYLKNKKTTQESFDGGWFHTGDLGVMHPDSYIELKDRSKDIIISGGENISSIEVEDTLYKNPNILTAAVVSKPDEKWGEVPCAFVELKDGKKTSAKV